MARTLVSQSNIRKIDVREPSALTTSHVPLDNINIQGANQLQLLISFTKGDSEGCELVIEFSEDLVNWYQESALSISEVVDVKEVIHKPVVRKIESSLDIVISVPVSASFFRISVAAITSGNGTSLSVTATIANI